MRSAVAALLILATPLAAQDFSAAVPAAYGPEYDALLSDPGNLDRLGRLARRAETDAAETGSQDGFRFAIRLYERMLLIDPGLSQIALRLGEIHFRLGEYLEADTYFRRALQDPDLPPEIRSTTRRYLEQIARQRSQNRFSGRIFAGIQHQSNPTLDDDQFLFQGPQGADFSLFSTISLRHTYDFGMQRGHTLELAFDATTQQYFELGEIDNSDLQVTFGPRLNLDDLSLGPASLRPYVIASTDWVAGDWYSYDYGVGLGFTNEPTDKLTLSADLRVVTREHNEDQSPVNRPQLWDGDEYEAVVFAAYAVSPRIDLGLGYGWRESNYADDLQFGLGSRYSRRNRVEVYGRARHDPLVDLGTGDWISAISLGYKHVDWFETPFGGSSLNYRDDWETTLAVSSEIPLTRSVRAIGGVAYTDYGSTQKLAEYRNWEVYLGLDHRF